MKTKLFTLATAGMLVASGMIYGFTSKNNSCPQEGTTDCPKISCPLAGSPECPYDLKEAVLDCCKKK